MLKYKNFGRKSLTELVEKLNELGLRFGMDIKEAVCSPRFHSQWYPDLIMIEPRGFSKDVMKNLNLMGHKIVPYKWGYIGEANGIYINKDGFFGGGDDRGETSAIGY